ncbi:MAG: BlaI/MecI/CopY family transcriptional regulator [Planctomycetaceae bacterium]|nr:BlaI/MecI/CopY family transcriptional regulator [Planctomycetaceae bacterium]
MGKKTRKNSIPLAQLAARERQIVEAVYRLGEAGVGEVLAAIDNPPTYSAVRAMMTTLVQKGVLKYRREKTKYLYSPVVGVDTAQRSVMRNLLDNFFAGNPAKAVAALLDVASEKLTDDDCSEIRKLIDNARKEGR